MAQYKSCIITSKGQQLMAKIIAGRSGATFTKMRFSDYQYQDSSLEGLTSLNSIKQEQDFSDKKILNGTSLQLTAAITNRNLTSGYYIKTIGVYANDPDYGEILYAVFQAIVPAWMPPYKGTSESSATFNVALTVGNTSNVTVTIKGSAVVTQDELNALTVTVNDNYKKLSQAYLSLENDGVYINYND